MNKNILIGVAIGVVLTVVAGAAMKHVHHKHDHHKRLGIPEAMKAEVYFDIGQYYFNHDEDQGPPYDRALARKYYEKAVAIDPEVHELAWYQLGRLDFIDSDFDGALEKFDTQVDLFGERVPNVWYMRGLVYGYKARQTGDEADWQKAEQAFKNFLPVFPRAPWTRVDLAWVYFAQGKYEEMLPVIEEGLEYHPDNAWLLNMHGLALLNTDEAEAAVAAFTQAQEQAAELTEEDWGRSYPGNNPALWGDGLAEFRSIIEKNLELANTSLTENNGS